VPSAASSDVQTQVIDLARRAAVGVANARVTMTATESRAVIEGYLEDAANLGMINCQAWGILASVSIAWMSELTRVLAEERGRTVEEEFQAMGALAAGVRP
jgi:hypothetical protein